MPDELPEAKLEFQIAPRETLEPQPALAPPIWRLRDLFLFLIFAISAFLFSNFLVVACAFGLRALVGWPQRLHSLSDNPYILLALQLVFEGLLVGYIYMLVVVNYRRPFWATLNWRNPSGRQATLYFVGGVSLALAVSFAPTVLPDKETFPLEKMFSTTGAAYSVAAFSVLVAPFVEELVFRGVIFAIFERQVGLRFAMLTTALLFAALHIPEYWGAWNHVLLISFVGIALSLARGLTGSLAPSVIVHTAYNLSLMLGLFFHTEHFRTLQSLLTP